MTTKLMSQNNLSFQDFTAIINQIMIFCCVSALFVKIILSLTFGQ